MRIFVNATPVDVVAGTALVTDARGIELPLDGPLEAGSIVRVVVRARRPAQDADADA